MRMSCRRCISWKRGERTLDYGDERKEGGQGEREDEHDKQDGPFVRVGHREERERVNTH